MPLANGLVPDALLVLADGAQRLRVGTAGRWAWVARQVQARYGWTPHIISGGGYRSLQQQVAIFTARYVPSLTGTGPFGDVRWWNGVRYIRISSAGAAAIPGASNHGLGRAVDVDGLLSFASTQHAQFATVATQAGFTDTEGRAVGEPWHWVDANDPDVTTVSAVVGTRTAPNIPMPGSLTPVDPQEDNVALSDQDKAWIANAISTAVLSQASQEAVDRVVAGEIDGRLRVRDGSKVPAGDAGVIVSQAGKEELDRMFANRLDEHVTAMLAPIIAELDALHVGSGGLTADEISAAVKAGLSSLTLKAQP